MDQERFAEVCRLVAGQPRVRKGIGTLGEKSLHAALKLYYEPDTSRHEQPLSGYVADILGPDGVIEIQTGGFDQLREKLALFLPHWPVTVVYPVPYIRHLCWLDEETGEVTAPRRSPKKGSRYEAVPELYKIKPLLKEHNLTICIAMIELEEYKRLNGYGKQRKIRAHRAERVPLALHEEIWLGGRDFGYSGLLPEGLPERFTSADFKIKAKVTRQAATTTLGILDHVGEVARVGKQGNAYLYERA